MARTNFGKIGSPSRQNSLLWLMGSKDTNTVVKFYMTTKSRGFFEGSGISEIECAPDRGALFGSRS